MFDDPYMMKINQPPQLSRQLNDALTTAIIKNTSQPQKQTNIYNANN
jgi:hypothetical protein